MNSKFRLFPLLVLIPLVMALYPSSLLAGIISDMAGSSALNLPEVQLERFGELGPAKEIKGQAKLKDCATTVEKAINEKEVQKLLGITLSQAQKDFLNEHKFLMIPKSATCFKGIFPGSGDGDWDEMLGMYDLVCGSHVEQERAPENAHLVTPTAVLHGFHKFFENTLEYLEKNDMNPTLKDLLTGLQEKALERRERGGDLASHYELLAAQFTVPIVLLENADYRTLQEQQPYDQKAGKAKNFADDQDTFKNAIKKFSTMKTKFSTPVQDKIEAELKLVYTAAAVEVSPLFGAYSKDGDFKSDYTQFTPRSHYAKCSALRAYFRAMIFLGRNGYLFETDNGLTDACLAVHLLAENGKDGKPLLDAWKKIMNATTFFAGYSDDLAYPQWRDYLVKTLGKSELSAEELTNSESLKKIAANLGQLAPPKIFSDVVVSTNIGKLTKEDLLKRSQSFRIFGQRFTFDGWVLTRLTAGDEKSQLRMPSMPSAIFVAAAFGSDLARKLVRQILQQETPAFSVEDCGKFDKLLSQIATDLGKVKGEEWFGSLSSAWLKLLGTLTGVFGDGFPLFMQSKLFPTRQLEVFLGSFTELKHDTLLYSKPCYAECGEGGEGEPPPCPKGFVEPNLPFWNELQRLVDYTNSGLKKLKIQESEREEYGRLNHFQKKVEFFRTFAEKELAGETISTEDYEKLRLTTLSQLASPYDSLDYTDEDRRSALIADIHTDATKGKVLYEANGEPCFILALVGNENTPRLTIGVEFNHFEFTGPLTTRMSDQTWQEQVYKKADALPKKNFWLEGLQVK
ncbi:MAG: DUF3160 domain-containing protein [Candidatus Riflebacteria bacterium]|nr:DUF3160 domain-containing protein [Candidatus Riflebacteria bacterium]